jgi:hypothetical protein
LQVEPKVWTERMLTALVQGVKGGKWFSLIDKVHPERTLAHVWGEIGFRAPAVAWISSIFRGLVSGARRSF